MIGGLDVYIRNAVMYSSSDIEYVLVHGDHDNARPVIKNGTVIKEYSISLYRSLNPFHDVKGLIQTIKIVRKEKPDIIHCHSAKGGFIGRCAGFYTRIKTFYTPHAFSFLSTNNKIKRFIFLLLERISRFKSNVLACSESEKEIAIRDAHYKKENVFVWRNSVPDVSPIVTNVNTSNEPYLCYIGRPSFQKNTLFLVDVIAKIHKEIPHLKCLLLGVGYYSPDLNELKSKIQNEHLEDVITLLPWLDHNDALAYVKQSLLYISVSRYEGLPLAIIESLALGKAVVASDVVGNRDCVRHGYNGFLLPLEVDEFVQKIITIVSNGLLREQLEQNARKSFEKDFLINNRIADLEKIYYNK